MKKKLIKLKFTDGFPENRFRLFKDRLEEEFELVYSDDPDYLFCGCYSNDYIKYPKAIRILFMGENMTPDFNLFDYAVGFDYLEFGDRYLRYPLSLCDKTSLERALKKHEMSDEYFKRDRFCNFVYSNNWCQTEIRNKIFEEINEKYKRVDSGGKVMNNIGGTVEDKHEFLKKYKFTLSIENSSYPGYSTEKITDAFAAGSIPIYWGDPRITEIFNSKSFIRISDYKSLDDCIEYIKEIDLNDDLYMAMQRESILPENNEGLQLYSEPNVMGEFVANIFRKPKQEAIRRCLEGYVTVYNRVIKYGWDRFLMWRRPARAILREMSKLKR